MTLLAEEIEGGKGGRRFPGRPPGSFQSVLGAD